MTERELKTLKEVRKAIAEADNLRAEESLEKAERRKLEETVAGLRKVERTLISGIQDGINDDLEAATEDLRSLSAEIRSTVTRLNAPARILEQFRDVLQMIGNVLNMIK